MFLREPPTTTLEEVRNSMDSTVVDSTDLPMNEVRFNLTQDQPSIVLGDIAEVPSTLDGLKAFGDWVDIPGKFMERIDPELQQHILSHMIHREGGVARVFYTDEGVQEVREPQIKLIRPQQLVDIAMKVTDPKALALEHWVTKDQFWLDVIVPEGFDRGVGGDPQVGDITRGGIRIIQDRKKNLAPSVSELLYRLWCTNGYEIDDASLKVDARGNTVEEVLAEFEAVADRAFRRVEKSIQHLYDMRTQRVENPEREIIRMAEEAHLPSRTVLTLAERVPAQETEEFTTFDLVNLISNQANDPSLINKSGARRKLQQTGGELITIHVERCGHCRAKLN